MKALIAQWPTLWAVLYPRCSNDRYVECLAELCETQNRLAEHRRALSKILEYPTPRDERHATELFVKIRQDVFDFHCREDMKP